METYSYKKFFEGLSLIGERLFEMKEQIKPTFDDFCSMFDTYLIYHDSYSLEFTGDDEMILTFRIYYSEFSISLGETLSFYLWEDLLPEFNELEVTEDDERYYIGNKVSGDNINLIFHALYLPMAQRKIEALKSATDDIIPYINRMCDKRKDMYPIDYIMVDNKEGLYGYHSEQE